MNRNAKRLVFASVVLGLLASLLVESGTTRATPPPQRRPGNKSRASRKTADLYRSNCARCHGGDGRGDTPLGHLYNAPDFTDPEWWRKNSSITSTRSLQSIIIRGKGRMPAFGKKLKRSEVDLLATYVRHFRNQSDATSPW